MTAVLAAVVSLLCALAAARRLWLAVAPGGLDHDLLQRAIGDAAALARLDQGLQGREPGRGGHGVDAQLVDAARAGDLASRASLIDEQVIEADWQSRRWASVPRVCASIATSAGFLCGVVSVIGALSAEPGDLSVGIALRSALESVAAGIAGAAFCVAVHVRLRPLMRARRAATARLVAHLMELGEPRLDV